KQVAKIANGFNANVFAYDPYVKDRKIYENLNVKYCETMDEILKNCDFISIHVPLTDETKNLINEKEINLMKKNAILINTSRGGVVNENALIEALKNKRIFGACLDVFENEPNINEEFLNLDNVILTPHIASQTEEAQKRAGKTIVEEIKRLLNVQ
ncbi:MAG: NAD(P)-dependent oxidoreductase, partial [Flavobacterium sp.]